MTVEGKVHTPSPTEPVPLVPGWTGPSATGVAPSEDSEITWLLHRAAQRLRSVTGEQAEKHGVHLRDYIVLTALHKTPGLTRSNWPERSGWTRPP